MPVDDGTADKREELLKLYNETRFPYLAVEEGQKRKIKDVLDKAFDDGGIAIDTGQVDRRLAVEARQKRGFRR